MLKMELPKKSCGRNDRDHRNLAFLVGAQCSGEPEGSCKFSLYSQQLSSSGTGVVGDGCG